jgi:hypothetical protein
MTKLTTADLDQGHALAAHASPGPYKATEDEDISGGWDEEEDKPTPVGYLHGPAYVECDEYVHLTPEDARYFAWLEPERVRELIRLARIGMEHTQGRHRIEGPRAVL